MAISFIPVADFPDFKSWDVISDADADQNEFLAHGFTDPETGLAVAPLLVWTSKLLNLVSLWGAATSGTQSIAVFKPPTAGSGNAGVQVRVYALRPHSLMR